MARRKTRAKNKPVKQNRPRKRSWWRSFSHFMSRPLVRQLLVVAIVVAVLFWQWPTVSAWVTGVAGGVIALFGWGLALIALLVLLVLVLAMRHKLASFARRWHLNYWNRWLAVAAFMLAAWGLLAFFNLGGDFGFIIIGRTDYTGVLRILGFLLLGVILVAPRACWRLVVRAVTWLVSSLKSSPKPKPAVKSAPVMTSPETVMPASEAVVPGSTAEAETSPERRVVPAAAAVPDALPQQELKQIAQEVWKKYGKSPTLVTVDGWRLPPVDILDRTSEIEFSQADNAQRARLIEEALASYGVDARVAQINAGPTVTQFGVEPGWDKKMKEVRERDKDGNIKVRMEEVSRTRVKVERITALSNNLALALASPSIRIEAPVPGKSVVGIEVPNTVSSVVSLRSVIETSAFQKLLSKSKLALVLGKGAGGEAVVSDLTKMPHLLIAGATGSGKTVCLNTIICCLLLHNSPSEARFIMIDPKRVELTSFNSIPHLAAPVIVDTDKALSAMRWLNQEMDRRYKELAAASARNIEAYNKNKSGEEKLPYLVLVIDELADLMMAGFDEVEHILCRLAQLARAVGIHLIVATQRPSVDVVTGLIKANFPTRISFAVTSQVDSRTILDMGGAEKLLGRGDMLFMPTEAAKPKRLQGCYVSDAETERLVYFWNTQKLEDVGQLKVGELIQPVVTTGKGSYPEDPLLDAAKQLAREHTNISTSFLQRRLHIGYPRAARLMEQLEQAMKEGDQGA